MGPFLQAFLLVSILICVQAGIAEERSDGAYEDGIGRLLLDKLQKKVSRDILYELLNRQSRRQNRLEQERLDSGLRKDDRESDPLFEDIHGFEEASELDHTIQDVRRKHDSSLEEESNRGLDFMTDKSDKETAGRLERRSLLSLDELVRYKTGTSIRKFQYYGCYCDGHAEKKPVDNLDRCCQRFNQCYKELINMNGCGSMYNSHWRIYQYKTANGQIKCLPNNPAYEPECKKKQCACDKGIADCLARYYDEFDNRYIGPVWNQERLNYCYLSIEEVLQRIG